jgi:hypothetical protein
MAYKSLTIFCLSIFLCFNQPEPTLIITLKHLLPPKLKESSGLCYSDGNLWTFCDSGNPPEIYKIDSSTGQILQTVVVSNFPNIDWEDMTADSLYLYIGDFGNNHGNRKDLRILRIKKMDINHPGDLLQVHAESIGFSYSEQTSYNPVSKTNYDCESMLSIGSHLYIFSKDGIDLRTRCYRLSKQPGNYVVSAISSFDSQGKITAACFNQQTGEIALLGYQNQKINSFIWFLQDYSGDQFFSGTNTRAQIGDLTDWQTEGLTFISKNSLMMTCEASTSRKAALYLITK